MQSTPKLKALLLLACSLGLNASLLADEIENPLLPPLPPTPPIPAADAPLVEVLATDPTALIGASSGAFTVIRSGSAEKDLAVQYTLTGTAVNGQDYALVENTVKIPAGFLAADIVIQPVAEPKVRGNKKVVLTLQAAEAYRLAKHKSAVLTIIDDLFNNEPPTVRLKSPAEGTTVSLPAVVTLEAEAQDVDDKVQRVSFYADDDLLGRATSSPFTYSWINPPPGTYALFARAVDEVGKSTLSAPVQITVKADAPTVALLSPKEGDVFPMGSSVKIEAEVKKGSGAIAKVQCWGDHRQLSPLIKATDKDLYSFEWQKVPAGSHTVTLRVTDEFGSSATAKVRFQVENKPPVVKLIKPEAGADFRAGTSLTLEAEASDADDAIQRVSFWANHRYLGTVKKSPYTLTWKNVPAGVYSLKAAATDVNGAKTTSSAVLISVSK